MNQVERPLSVRYNRLYLMLYFSVAKVLTSYGEASSGYEVGWGNLDCIDINIPVK